MTLEHKGPAHPSQEMLVSVIQCSFIEIVNFLSIKIFIMSYYA